MSLILMGTKRFYDVSRLPTRTRCTRCRNLVTYRFVRTRRWLTYFFIPVLPLSTTEELLCPVCEPLLLVAVLFRRRGLENYLHSLTQASSPSFSRSE